MVNFEFDSDRLTAAGAGAISASSPRRCTTRGSRMDEKFAIDGFTDATGTEMYNNSLSERRAEAVVNYLSAAAASTREALVAKGFGPSKPRAPDPFDPLNRRVETHLVEITDARATIPRDRRAGASA